MKEKRFKKVFILLLINLMITITSFSMMSISPIYFNQRIDGMGGYQEYTIDNDSFNTIRYKIKVTPVTDDKEMYKRMEKWIEIYPKVLTIKPKSSGKIKLLIKADKDAKFGEYRFNITPEPIYIPKLNEKKSDSKISYIKSEMPLVLTLNIESYIGNLGEITKDVEFHKTKDSLEIINHMKREIVLDVDVKTKKEEYRDTIKLKKDDKEIREYGNDIKELKIYEAGTEEIIKDIFY